MKKIISVMLVLLCVSSVFASNYNPKRPEWKDFCPFGMENAQPVQIKWYNNYYQRLKMRDVNYWVQRKEDFEKDLTTCDNLPNKDQNSCYEKLTVRQQQINQSYISPKQIYDQDMANASLMLDGLNQQTLQQQQLNLQKTQMLLQNAPKWNADAYTPKTYNVNLNHNIKYGGF